MADAPSYRKAVDARSLSCPMSRRHGPHETNDYSNDEPATVEMTARYSQKTMPVSHTYCVVGAAITTRPSERMPSTIETTASALTPGAS